MIHAQFIETSKKQLFLLFIAICLFRGPLSGQPITTQGIDTVAENALKAFNVPGMAVAVVKDGKVIHAKGYGVRSLKTQQPVDEKTIFGIASNSKAFTAAALGMLIEENKLKWDTKVRDIIPEFRLYDPYVTEEFTVRDLLTHRSGLGLGAGDLMFFPDSSDFKLNDVLTNLRFLKPVSSFRSKFDYDNNMYIIAGEIVKRVSGMKWEDFVEQRIFKPLGMTKTAGSFERLPDKSNVIDGHAPVDGKVQVIRRSSSQLWLSAAGVNSNIEDLSKWITALMAGGSYGEKGEKELFSNAVIHEMWSPQTIIPLGGPGPYNTHFSAYGIGFFLSDVNGYLQATHTGGLEGMVTQITMIPELKLGIIVLTNQQEGGAFSSVTNQIKDSYFGIKGTDRVKEYSERRNKSVKNAAAITDSVWSDIKTAAKSPKSTPDLPNYTGVYKDSWLGTVNISMINGKPWFASVRSPKLTGELFYLRANTFVVKWNDRSMDADAYLLFELDETGKAQHISMKPISPLTDFSYDFQDLYFTRVVE